MKNIFTLFLVLSTFSFYGQDKKISFLDLVGNHIQVPRGCQAQSEYELQACNGTTVKWDYYSGDMLSAVFDATITAFEEANGGKTEITFVCFGFELKGYKFKTGTTYQYFIQGKIKDQPLMMNLATPANISVKDDMDNFLRQLFDEVS
ncbi:hypothetical protein [Aquimarina sp. 2201CG5-10]|uniref:hypothetical protein n=1 Tax=Aquimarina callyspongiae TaxID=3098150 RepID=UPI002AB42B0D|nr:hypothetical protein [Aquimarina sp. 2201CG5-10]MDY8134444.1 hypothetical protein [Aquimarina sp. 2201CG5-10]